MKNIENVNLILILEYNSIGNIKASQILYLLLEDKNNIKPHFHIGAKYHFPDTGASVTI